MNTALPATWGTKQCLIKLTHARAHIGWAEPAYDTAQGPLKLFTLSVFPLTYNSQAGIHKYTRNARITNVVSSGAQQHSGKHAANWL